MVEKKPARRGLFLCISGLLRQGKTPCSPSPRHERVAVWPANLKLKHWRASWAENSLEAAPMLEFDAISAKTTARPVAKAKKI
jgi:hypothetical protein